MNLNISTQFMNDFQANITTKDITSSKCEFKTMFEGLEVIDEETHLDINEKEIEDDSIYEFIQSLLTNIKIIDFNDKANINKNTFSDLEKVLEICTNTNENIENREIDDKMPLLKKIKSLSKNSKIKDSIVKDEIKLINNEINKFTNKYIENKEINHKVALFKEIGLSLKYTKFTDNITNNKNKLIKEVKNFQEYQQLEVSSLSKKNNILDNSVNSSKIKDKNLSTLEKILNINSGNEFMIQNSNLNLLNIDTSADNGLKETPVNSIRQEFIGEDVIKTVKYLKSNGLEEIKIKISPRELGDMTIKLIKDTKETKVSITISKEDVFDMVNKNIGDITKHLNDMNIKVKEILVDIKNNNQNLFSDNLNKEFNKRNQENKKKRNKYEQVRTENIEEVKQKEIIEENINILI